MRREKGKKRKTEKKIKYEEGNYIKKEKRQGNYKTER